MALIQTAQAGLASNALTWVGAALPGIGDRIQQRHDVTWDIPNHAVGHSPAHGSIEDAISVENGATLYLAPGVVLRHLGDITATNGRIRIGEGAQVLWDNTLSLDPANTRYGINLNQLYNQTFTALLCEGKAAAWCNIGPAPGVAAGAWNQILAGDKNNGNYPTVNGGRIEASYTFFVGLGNASNRSWLSRPNSLTLWSKFTNCIWDRCSEPNVLFANGNVGLEFEDCSWVNTVGQYSFRFGGWPVITAGYENTIKRRLVGCVHDKEIDLTNSQDWEVRGNVHLAIWRYTYQPGKAKSPFRDSFVYRADPNPGVFTWVLPYGSTVLDNYWFIDSTGDNPHYLAFTGSYNGGGPTHIEGNISETNTASEVGDIWQFTDAPTTGTMETNVFTLTRNISIPNGIGKSPGAFFALTSVNPTPDRPKFRIFASRNTIFIGGNEGGMTISEGTQDFAGEIGRVSSNIFWDVTARGYKLKDVGTNFIAPDAVLPEDCAYNCGWNYLAGTNGNGYHQLELTDTSKLGAFGATDFDADPMFRDPARNLRAWDAANGGPGTVANAVAKMARKNHPDFDGRYTVKNLIAWVREGFTPQNPRLRRAGDLLDAGPNGLRPDVGAVDILGAPTTVAFFIG